MIEIITYALSQIFTKAFWAFVLCSFLGVLLFSFRNSFRSDIFKATIDWAKAGKPNSW